MPTVRRKIHAKIVNLSQRRKTNKNPNMIRSSAFKPGSTPNPGGRPKIPKEFSALMKEYSVEAAEELHYWMLQRDPKVSPAICQYIINRAYGMPTQANEISGPGGTALQPPSLNIAFVSVPQVKEPEPELIEQGVEE